MTAGRTPNTHHVVPNRDGCWDVKRRGSNRSSGHFDTKREAVNRGREISLNAGTELKIHNLNGKISGSDSHGNGPFPPPG